VKDLLYAWEKLYDAVGGMVSSSKDIRSRLESAYLSSHGLQFSRIPREDFAKRLQDIMNARTKSSTGRLTLGSMSDDDMEALARKIFDLFVDIDRDHSENRL